MTVGLSEKYQKLLNSHMHKQEAFPANLKSNKDVRKEDNSK